MSETDYGINGVLVNEIEEILHKTIKPKLKLPVFPPITVGAEFAVATS